MEKQDTRVRLPGMEPHLGADGEGTAGLCSLGRGHLPTVERPGLSWLSLPGRDSAGSAQPNPVGKPDSLAKPACSA